MPHPRVAGRSTHVNLGGKHRCACQKELAANPLMPRQKVTPLTRRNRQGVAGRTCASSGRITARRNTSTRVTPLPRVDRNHRGVRVSVLRVVPPHAASLHRRGGRVLDGRPWRCKHHAAGDDQDGECDDGDSPHLSSRHPNRGGCAHSGHQTPIVSQSAALAKAPVNQSAQMTRPAATA